MFTMITVVLCFVVITNVEALTLLNSSSLDASHSLATDEPHSMTAGDTTAQTSNHLLPRGSKPVQSSTQNFLSLPKPKTLKVGDTDCDVFYQHGKMPRQAEEREANVKYAMHLFPQIRKLKSLSWTEDWDTVIKLYKKIGMVVSIHDLKHTLPGSSQAAKGKIAHWATLLLALTYQVELERPCMVLLEDDLRIPVDFDVRLAKLKLPPSAQELLWFQSDGVKMAWGEGLVLSLSAARYFLKLLCLTGIHEPTDQFVLDHFVLHMAQLHTRRLVKPNSGNIYGSPQADPAEFGYVPKVYQGIYAKLMTAFDPSDTLGPEVDLKLVAQRMINPGANLLPKKKKGRSFLMRERRSGQGIFAHIRTTVALLVVGLFVTFLAAFVMFKCWATDISGICGIMKYQVKQKSSYEA